MSSLSSRQMTSTLAENGKLTVEIVEQVLPDPAAHEVVIEVEAAPINPSDLGLLFGPADLTGADFSNGRIVADMPEKALRAMRARVGQPIVPGNEGAGTVIAAGAAPAAQALLGKRVACVPGGMYAEHRIADARRCMILPEGTTAEQGAAAFVNPLTALGFVETMRRDGHHAIVHTAAASNLGQMLVRICREDDIPLVNIVRNPQQVAILRDIGAEHVLDSSRETFVADLFAAIETTGATVLFDAIGGGKLVSQIMTAMEAAASKGAGFARYGSTTLKQAWIYGALDTSPTVLTRNYGFSWCVGGWLLTPFLASIGEERAEALRQRVRDGLTTTFASKYKAQVTLEEALTREVALAYNARRTGEKYLIVPGRSGK